MLMHKFNTNTMKIPKEFCRNRQADSKILTQNEFEDILKKNNQNSFEKEKQS